MNASGTSILSQVRVLISRPESGRAMARTMVCIECTFTSSLASPETAERAARIEAAGRGGARRTVVGGGQRAAVRRGGGRAGALVCGRRRRRRRGWHGAGGRAVGQQGVGVRDPGARVDGAHGLAVLAGDKVAAGRAGRQRVEGLGHDQLDVPGAAREAKMHWLAAKGAEPSERAPPVLLDHPLQDAHGLVVGQVVEGNVVDLQNHVTMFDSTVQGDGTPGKRTFCVHLLKHVRDCEPWHDIGHANAAVTMRIVTVADNADPQKTTGF